MLAFQPGIIRLGPGSLGYTQISLVVVGGGCLTAENCILQVALPILHRVSAEAGWGKGWDGLGWRGMRRWWSSWRGRVFGQPRFREPDGNDWKTISLYNLTWFSGSIFNFQCQDHPVWVSNRLAYTLRSYRSPTW